MTIRKNSWHYKVYCWFTDSETESVNLCPYVRTVFIWSPLRFFFGDGKIRRVYVAAVTWPLLFSAAPIIVWHFQRKAAIAILWAYLVCAAVISLTTGIPVLLQRAQQRRKTYLLSQMNREERSDYKYYGRLPERLQRKRFKGIREAWDLVCEYASAAHNKVCPILEVEK